MGRHRVKEKVWIEFGQDLLEHGRKYQEDKLHNKAMKVLSKKDTTQQYKKVKIFDQFNFEQFLSVLFLPPLLSLTA